MVGGGREGGVAVVIGGGDISASGRCGVSLGMTWSSSKPCGCPASGIGDIFLGVYGIGEGVMVEVDGGGAGSGRGDGVCVGTVAAASAKGLLLLMGRGRGSSVFAGAIELAREP